MKMSLWMLKDTCWGVAKWPKAPDFDSGIRRFESFHPSHSFPSIYLPSYFGFPVIIAKILVIGF